MKVTLLLAALGLPTLALAQSSSFAPHGYLGAGVSGYTDTRDDLAYWRHTTSVGPMLTAGYQFTSRLAVQLSPAVQWRGDANSYTSRRTPTGQPLTTTDSRTRQSWLTVPLLLRVTFTNPATRLHVDGLLGAAWLHYGSSYAATETDNGTSTVLNQQHATYAYNTALLTLAPALRYAVSPRFELALLLPLHYELRSDFSDYYVPAFGDHLRLQSQLSVYYALGGR